MMYLSSVNNCDFPFLLKLFTTDKTSNCCNLILPNIAVLKVRHLSDVRVTSNHNTESPGPQLVRINLSVIASRYEEGA